MQEELKGLEHELKSTVPKSQYDTLINALQAEKNQLAKEKDEFKKKNDQLTKTVNSL